MARVKQNDHVGKRVRKRTSIGKSKRTKIKNKSKRRHRGA